MSVSEYPKKVYKEDGEGNTYCLQETVYRGKTIHYNSAFPEPSYVLDNLLSLKSKDSDVWLVTFPRSGTHWMYEILTVLTSGKLAPSSVPMAERDVTLRSSFERKDDEVVPMIHVAHLKHKYIPSQVFKQQKVIYVIRNPKSVAVSYYSLRCRLSAFEYSGTFSGFLPTFFENPITLFGNWFEHVTQYWTALKNHPNVLFVCYEDLMRDPLKAIEDISSFLACNHHKQFCEQVVRLTTVEVMKDFEQQKLAKYSKYLWKDGEAGFIRKGNVDNWKTWFTVAQNEHFDSVYEREMKDYPDLKEKIKFE